MNFISMANIFLVLVFNSFPVQGAINMLPLWTWECVNDICVQLKANNTTILQSLITCNMLCSTINFWPQPTGIVTVSSTAFPVDPDSFILEIIAYPSEVVKESLYSAFKFFQNNLRKIDKHKKNRHQEVFLNIEIDIKGDKDPRMRTNTDESYVLQIKPDNTSRSLVIDIQAKSFCGARHGIETLTQLIWHDPYRDSLLLIESATITDTPKFRYRGLMLDTASNYFPLKEIKRSIDAMAVCKLNTFHWHITNSRRFPLFLKSVPFLENYRTYGQSAVYTPDKIRELVNYAEIRGIRIILEVNLPLIMLNSPENATNTIVEQFSNCFKVHKLQEQIFTEVINISNVDDIFHMGFSNTFKTFSNENSNVLELSSSCIDFSSKTLRSLKRANNGTLPLTILWSSNLSERLKIDYKKYVDRLVIQAYNVTWGHRYISGIKTILSHVNSWVLNTGHGSWFGDTNGAQYTSWQHIYEHRPWAHKSITGMEGGEVIVWSHTLSPGGLDAHVWPRASAVAERLWSDRAEGATRSVQARLDIHRGRLVQRGIRAAPISSYWCTQNPLTC